MKLLLIYIYLFVFAEASFDCDDLIVYTLWAGSFLYELLPLSRRVFRGFFLRRDYLLPTGQAEPEQNHRRASFGWRGQPNVFGGLEATQIMT